MIGGRHAARTMLVLGCAAVTGASAAACSSEPSPGPMPGPTMATDPASLPVVVDGVEPARSLLPANVGDDYGARIGSLIYRGLFRYDAKGRLVNEVAEDVTAEGPLRYRIKVRRTYNFGNGEPVTAASFVNAWNFAADPANAQLHADAFSSIAGYRTLRGLPEPATAPTATATAGGTATTGGTAGAPTAPASPTSSAPTSSAPSSPSSGAPSDGATPTTNPPATVAPGPHLLGLTLVNEFEFTVQLAVPDATFRDRLATLPFAPLPSAALRDPAAYAANPVGDGPYQLSGGWVAGKEIRLIRNASYTGSDPARNGGITFRFFPDPSLTYPALLDGRLDVLDAMPLTALDRYKADLGFRAANQSVGSAASIVFPMNQPQWASPAGLAVRKAVSRSIDRKALADGLFAGTRAPAGDLAAPVVPGNDAGACGDACSYDPKAAAALLASATPAPAPLQIAYGVDAGGRPAVEAICGAVTVATRLQCVPLPVPSQASLELAAARHQLTVPMLSLRRMARPELGGFLAPRFVAGSADNPSAYAGAAAQTLLTKAAALDDAGARTDAYREAEKVILSDLPEVPLWSVNATVGQTDRVQQVKIDVFGLPIYTELARS